ncbi:MAG: dephospho-CoA kinase [Thermoguttaceae bacterium]|nr:dephospho-CoA kinase [Thermoguttaceae bacterium]
MTKNRALLFAVVGGIGSGKSFATAALRAFGFPCFDADAEARRLFDDPAILDVLRDRWGADVVSPSGTVDRRRLAEIVFAPTAEARAELDFLNRTTRPPLLARFRRWLDAVRASDAEFAVLDAPLLFEVGWERDVDFVIFVEASRATRVRRVAERGWSPEELDRREANQLPLAVKRKRADFVLVNDDAPNVFNAENAENAVKNGKNDKNNKGERDAANAAPFSADATAQIARIVDEARRRRDARP